MALSATIGNPEALQGWLQSLKSLQQKQDRVAGTAAKGSVYDVRLIVHRERYADLRWANTIHVFAELDGLKYP